MVVRLVADGSAAALDDPATPTPRFTPDVFGDYVVQLIVNDGLVDSAADTVVIGTGNTAPVARAGADRTVAAGAVVELDGSGSTDVDGQTLTYAWSLATVPAGSTAVGLRSDGGAADVHGRPRRAPTSRS